MDDQREEQHVRTNGARAALESERRQEDRRKKSCEGYCYIEMVGWMDRRESLRRRDTSIS
ncbi:hypothetical protein DSCA_38140 [Desulfosarcina alkanivorans]|uniref:Uncharacterized protein n=1 Tax=Desulfosarcina alkanivorans TaxID=571177 RepID=A0A5K7YUB8_9BACT|nr:hypothetical protein [Desulfosarcina alkanivorans]BBO69884.1 hypothetical protein DSCA_38140 [Desulfosarcina alkanivorans]